MKLGILSIGVLVVAGALGLSAATGIDIVGEALAMVAPNPAAECHAGVGGGVTAGCSATLSAPY